MKQILQLKQEVKMKNNKNNDMEKKQAKRLEVIKYFFHKFKITEKELTKEE